MSNYKTSLKFVAVALLLVVELVAQELPPIVKFGSTAYGAGNQNWMIAHDINQFVYFANNEGLLEFNGSNWNIYPSPNETIIRSVKVVGDKIYTGCYMEFGYWKRQANGFLKYTSLSQKIKNKLIEDEHFWNIISFDHWVLFQSFNRVYVYNSKSGQFQFIDKHPYIFRCYKINNSVYFQAIGEGLYEIINGKSLLVSNDERIKNNRIVEIYKQDEGLLLQTERAGVFKLDNKVITPYLFESDSELRQNSVFCAKMLSDGGFALGTISNGIYILNRSGKIRYHITQNSGLSNNTVLSIEEDDDNNLWLGLDNGIDCINLQSPIRSFKDDSGFLGTVYASIKFKDNLYIGTNQGLFYKNASGNDNFSLIPGTKGQNTINTKKTKINNIEEGFHLYAIEWTKDKIEFFVDNQSVYTFAPEIKNENIWPFDQPFYFIINVAVGGNFGGHDVDNSIFPQEFVIDYIRVYQ